MTDGRRPSRARTGGPCRSRRLERSTLDGAPVRTGAGWYANFDVPSLPTSPARPPDALVVHRDEGTRRVRRAGVMDVELSLLQPETMAAVAIASIPVRVTRSFMCVPPRRVTVRTMSDGNAVTPAELQTATLYNRREVVHGAFACNSTAHRRESTVARDTRHVPADRLVRRRVLERPAQPAPHADANQLHAAIVNGDVESLRYWLTVRHANVSAANAAEPDVTPLQRCLGLAARVLDRTAGRRSPFE